MVFLMFTVLSKSAMLVSAMLSLRLTLLLCIATVGWTAEIEARNGADWPTANHFRVRHTSSAAAGVPLALDFHLPAEFNPDSVRVMAGGKSDMVPSKTEWRNPQARINFRSTGADTHFIYFDESDRGETKRLAAPAMAGTGDRITYGRVSHR